MTSMPYNTVGASPLVSVIMPTYNRGAFIGPAIESVLTQTCRHLELIVVDNYSEDDTEAIVRSWARQDQRVKYFKYANHGLVAASRNAGMEAASGRYLAFLDSDDTWLPEKVAKQVAFLEDHPDVFLVYSRFFVKRHATIVGVGPRARMVRGRAFRGLFLSDNMIGSLTVMMRREADGSDPYRFSVDRELYAIEDYDLWLRVSRTRVVDYLDEPLAVYNIHGANMTRSLRLYFSKNVRLMKMYRREVPWTLWVLRCLVCFVPAVTSTILRSLPLSRLALPSPRAHS